MPLDEDIKGGHGEGEAGVEVLPAPMHHLLEVADHGQHGEHRLHQHAILPLPARTEFEVGRVALGGMETGIAQDNHPAINLSNEPRKGVIDVSTTIGYLLKAGQLEYDCRYSTMHGMPVTGGPRL